MADPATRAGKPAAPAKKGGEFLGQPTWIWAVGAGAILLGYLYIKSKSSAQPTSGQGGPRQGGGPTGWTTDTFRIWVRDHHGQPSPPGPKPKPPKGDGKGK